MEIVTGRPQRLEKEMAQRVAARLLAGERVMALVPAQETLHTELALMEGAGVSGSFFLDVLSPGRLRERVLERGGRPEEAVFDERGRRMLIAAILTEERENLTFYAQAAASGAESLAAKLSEAIACWKRAELSPEALREKAEEAPGALAGKLRDAALVYARYEECIASRLRDAEDMQRYLAERMGASGVLRDQHVLVTGFDMITPGFASELAAIDGAAASLTLFIETDANSAPDGRLFAPVNASLSRLQKLLQEKNRPCARFAVREALGAPEDLQALEAGLFALDAAPYAGAPEHIFLRPASTTRMEAERCAAAIRRLAAEGEPLSEMAVLYPRGSVYPSLLAAALPEMGIAAYTAEKRPASSHPLARFLLGALGALDGGSWRMQEVIECAQSGFFSFSREQADALAAYCERMEIRGGQFGRPFRYKLEQEMTDEAFEAVEAARQAVAGPLKALHEVLNHAGTSDDVVGAVLALLETVGAADTLEAMARELMERGLISEAQDCAQLWNALMDILDQLHALLGDGKASAQLTRELLQSGLSALELSALPPAEGAVLCGEIGNLRPGRVNTVFVLGMNDGQEEDAAGLFRPEERALVETDGVYLGLNDEERVALARLDMLKAFSLARERLIISWALADEAGQALREGEAVQALRRLFPDAPIGGCLPEEERRELLCAPLPAARAIALQLRDGGADEGFAAACAGLASGEATAPLVQTLRAQLQEPLPLRLERRQAERLYGKAQTASVSRLETFAACPFKYYARYGLRPAGEPQPGRDPAQLGTLYHEAVRRFAEAAMERQEFPRLDEETLTQILKEAEGELLADWRQTPLGESGRGRAMERRIHRTAERAAREVLSQAQEGGFVPRAMELGFGLGGLPALMIRLADGTHLHLAGRIDRVDVLMEDGKTIRIIDYKSSARKVDATKIYYGLQLQLLLYLQAALMAMPGTEAAGFFYFRIQDPTVTTENRVREEVEKKLAERMALSGVSLSEVRILRAMDARHARMINKDGSVRKGTRGLVDADGMRGLLRFAAGKAASLAEEASSGMIDDCPTALPGPQRETACAFCEFAAVCGFDPERKPLRQLSKKTLEEVAGEGQKLLQDVKEV